MAILLEDAKKCLSEMEEVIKALGIGSESDTVEEKIQRRNCDIQRILATSK